MSTRKRIWSVLPTTPHSGTRSKSRRFTTWSSPKPSRLSMEGALAGPKSFRKTRERWQTDEQGVKYIQLPSMTVKQTLGIAMLRRVGGGIRLEKLLNMARWNAVANCHYQTLAGGVWHQRKEGELLSFMGVTEASLEIRSDPLEHLIKAWTNIGRIEGMKMHDVIDRCEAEGNELADALLESIANKEESPTRASESDVTNELGDVSPTEECVREQTRRMIDDLAEAQEIAAEKEEQGAKNFATTSASPTAASILGTTSASTTTSSPMSPVSARHPRAPACERIGERRRRLPCLPRLGRHVRNRGHCAGCRLRMLNVLSLWRIPCW